MPPRRGRPKLAGLLGPLAAAALLAGCAPPMKISGFAPPTNVVSFSHPHLDHYPLRRIAVFYFENRSPSPEAGKRIAEFFYQALKERTGKLVFPPMPVDYELLGLEIPLGQRVGGRLPPPVVTAAAIGRVLDQVEPALREALEGGELEPHRQVEAPEAFRAASGVIPRQIRLSEDEKAAIDDAAGRNQSERLVDAVLVGVIGRYRNRQGHPLTVVEPASVAYNIYLLSALDGATLWQASFDETQVPLFENIMLIDRFVEGRGVWQTHDTLTRIGVSRVLSTFPGVRPPPQPPSEPTVIETE